jgi:putative membrane protein
MNPRETRLFSLQALASSMRCKLPHLFALAALLLGPSLSGAARPTFADVLSSVHWANQREMAIGAIAKQRGQTREVRALGDRILRDHNQAERLLLNQAERARVALHPSPTSPAEHRRATEHEKLMADLGILAADEFDSFFLKVMRKRHQEVGHQIVDAIASLPATEARELLVKLRPIFAQHQRLATALLKRSS